MPKVIFNMPNRKPVETDLATLDADNLTHFLDILVKKPNIDANDAPSTDQGPQGEE